MASLERHYSCPSRSTLGAFLSGSLSPAETELIALHIDECPDCTRLLPELDEQLPPLPVPVQSTPLPYIDEAACSRLTRLLCTTSAGRQHGTGDFHAGPGIRIGRFEVVRRLAAGTASTVFLASDPQLGRFVALRVPSPHTIGDQQVRRRFVEAGNRALRAGHPHLIPVDEVVDDDQRPCVVSRYCAGPTLQAWLNALRQPLDMVSVARLARNLADAVEHASGHGILFRTLPPASVLVEALCTVDAARLPDAVRLSAFQLSSSDGEAEDCRTTGRAQPYVVAVGELMYRLLTGREPARGGLVRRLLWRGPVPPQRFNRAVPCGLQQIVLRSLEPASARNYRRAADLRDDLDRFVDQVSAAG